MDNVKTVDTIEEEIAAIMRERAIDRIQAETIIGMRDGEWYGNDMLILRSLTDEQRRTLGLSKSIHDVVAEERGTEHRRRLSEE